MYDGSDIKKQMQKVIDQNTIQKRDGFIDSYERWYIIISVLFVLYNEENELLSILRILHILMKN